jgi:hypothetical protein
MSYNGKGHEVAGRACLHQNPFIFTKALLSSSKSFYLDEDDQIPFVIALTTKLSGVKALQLLVHLLLTLSTGQSIPNCNGLALRTAADKG